jgi:glutathione S-transferase
MKLYWSSRSPFVRKVMIVAHETGIADRIERIPVEVALAKPNKAVMADNPLNKIPALVRDDGLALFDSLVICEYLDALQVRPTLIPPAGDARWRALRWHALGNGLLDLLILWRSERMRPDGQRADAVLAAFAVKLAPSLARLEDEADALAAAPFGIGQIGVGCALAYLDFRFADQAWRTGRDRLARWYVDFAARPSVVATAFFDPV